MSQVQDVEVYCKGVPLPFDSYDFKGAIVRNNVDTAKIIRDMKEEAAAMGANAIIGVDIKKRLSQTTSTTIKLCRPEGFLKSICAYFFGSQDSKIVKTLR